MPLSNRSGWDSVVGVPGAREPRREEAVISNV
jgi:hypothetical protein